MTNGVANHHRISIISSFGYFYPPHGSTGLGRPAPTPQSSTSTTPLRTFGEATPSPILDNIARITTRSKTTTQDNSDSSRSSPPETVSPVDPVLLGGGMSSTEVNALSQAYSGLTLGKLAPKHIDYFSGENFQDFNEWHRQFEDIIRTSVVPLPEQGKVNTLYATLRGEARDVIDEMQPEDRNNYDKIISFLRSHFEKPQFQDAAKRELANCRQNAGEDVYSYSKRIKKAVYNFMRHEPQTKIQQKLLEEFVDRLRLDLKFFVRPHKCKTFEDALEKAADYEALHKEASDNNLVYHPELHIFVPKADLARRTTPETNQERMDPPMADNFRPREATVYGYHDSPTLDSTIGPLQGCRYEDGSCTTKDGAAVIWTPESEEKFHSEAVFAKVGLDLCGPLKTTDREEPPTTPTVAPESCVSETSPGDVHLEEEKIDVQDVETSLTTSITESSSAKDGETSSIAPDAKPPMATESQDTQATGVTVGTVDSAQGSERSVVILCTTRTQMETRTTRTFFSDEKRLNVALSRGRRNMVGHRPLVPRSWRRHGPQLLRQPDAADVTILSPRTDSC
ncbi:unnamed protein product [Cylicocyclus nassatus]|uniref:Retrotransposon gag domain-containing protein n=1 Tax=Cylicocyclus nassatus TaxID=53992 RepID=A0AA36H807_CYLNA|nr:unnamed protein product [Cylicocyclus nassatus]